MIPLRDSTRSRRFPYVNVALIALNVIIFFKELTLSHQELNQVFYVFGVVPAKVNALLNTGAPLIPLFVPFISAMFLHGSWVHIIGNMLYLWIFGDNVEDRLGHFNYLIFYLLAGIAGSAAHIITNPGSEVPIIGASGAIAGVLGAYFLSFPRSRILTLVPLLFFITIVEVPAVFFLLFWFVIQLLNGITTAGVAANPVAWWAHVGGFLAGAILIKLFPDKRTSYF
ncbi:MAG: Rhomboid domain containing peptidase [Thermoanaerobacterales bacterium 50_218]|nr:MAG: Rhomboid domain containing peptidase [Thermoanaerobacterales bacterium 50_218]HAA89656.1 rhomboid family intramembrane serine protease [Peptococcaceae bacterium]